MAEKMMSLQVGQTGDAEQVRSPPGGPEQEDPHPEHKEQSAQCSGSPSDEALHTTGHEAASSPPQSSPQHEEQRGPEGMASFSCSVLLLTTRTSQALPPSRTLEREKMETETAPSP